MNLKNENNYLETCSVTLEIKSINSITEAFISHSFCISITRNVITIARIMSFIILNRNAFLPMFSIKSVVRV